MELDGADVVKVAIQRKQASSRLVRPDLDLVVVASRDEHGLRFMKVDCADWAIVFLESVNQCAHAVVPQLNRGRVEGDEDPWSMHN